jgi:outer membrane protein assembly factor BamA
LVVSNLFKILFICFLINFKIFVYSQAERFKLLDQVTNLNSVIELYLIVDGEGASFYSDMLHDLSLVPLPELEDAIISLLLQTNLYQSVEVDRIISDDNKLVFVAKAETIKRVHDIIINGMSSAESSDYLKFLSTQRGRPFVESTLKNDTLFIQKNLVNHGYLNAKVDSVQINEITNQYLQIVFNIDKGNPCRIDQVIIQDSFSNVLNFLTLPIETGSICDQSSINDALDLQRESYYGQGYLKASVRIKAISYSTNNESAKITLEIDKGPKTIFQIYDEETGILNQDFVITDQGYTYSDILIMSDADLLSIINNFYQKQGFAFSNVLGPEKIIDNNGNTILKFILKKGNFVKIGKISFIGEDLNETKILENLGINSSFFSSGVPFYQENLNSYRDKVKSIFLNEGYLNVNVYMPDFIPSIDKKEMNLLFRIEKGSRYIANKIEINGLSKNFELVKKNLDSLLKKGDPLSYSSKQNYFDEIKKQLFFEGYLYSQIRFTQSNVPESRDKILVNLQINIEMGPLVRIRKIYVDTQIVGKDNTIISTSLLKEGDVFSQEKFDDARIRLLKHDLFSSVLIEALDFSAFDRKETRIDIIIHAYAKTGYSLALSPSWSSFKGYVFDTDYVLNKLNSDGLKFISNLTVSQEKQQQSFASSDTRQILGAKLSLGLSESLFKLGTLTTPFDVSSVLSYQVAAETLTNREYLTLQFSGDWKPGFWGLNWNIRQSFMYERSKSTSSESAVVQTLDSPSVSIFELLTNASLDTRNSPAWPTSGSYYSLQFGLSRFGLGSEVQFNRYNFSYDTYFPIYGKLSGAVSLGGKFIRDTVNQFGSTVTPPASRRATLTENALVRGFPETYGSTAPGPLLWIHYANNGVPNCTTQLASIGATNLIYFKSETRYRFNEVFGMVLFLDSAFNYFTKGEVAQINDQINKQIGLVEPSATQCVPDAAALISPSAILLNGFDFFEQYWKNAYVSTGIGFRIILGNYAALSLDYGYPLKDPSQNQNNCMTTVDALNATTPPSCVLRIQKTSYLNGDIEFKGALHLRIGAQF